MEYPRVLIVSGYRINAADTANNGLLLRNLFGAWPKSHLAQIYSGGDNGDEGFFGAYYQLGPQDRRLGNFFYRMKAREQSPKEICSPAVNTNSNKQGKSSSIKSLLKQIVID